MAISAKAIRSILYVPSPTLFFLFIAVVFLLSFGLLGTISFYYKFTGKKKNEDFFLSLLKHPFNRTLLFESLLNFPRQVQFETVKCDDTTKTLSLEYKIPVSSTNGVFMDLGCLLSLVDVITSMTFIVYDKCHRPGVSVSLSGQCHYDRFTTFDEYSEQLRPGKIIRLEAKMVKSGANLGFSNMTIRSSDGMILATATHLKFLNHGFIWNTFGKFLPAIRNMCIHWIPQYFDDPSKPAVSFEGVNLCSSIMMAPILHESNEQTLHKGFGYNITVYSLIQNVFKALHGGAIACTFHHTALSYLSSSNLDTINLNENRKKGPYIRHIHVEYLSPATGQVSVHVEPCDHPVTPSSDKVEGVNENDSETSTQISGKVGDIHHSFKIVLKKSKRNTSNDSKNISRDKVLSIAHVVTT